jgi:hypothetical protein
MILRFSEHVGIDEDGEIAFSAYLSRDGKMSEAVLGIAAGAPIEIGVEGETAPGGGRYAGFGPWPTMGSGGATAFIAALDGASGPLGVFLGTADNVKRVALAGESLSQTEILGRFALNAVAAAGPSGSVTFATIARDKGERTAIYCRCFAQAP